MRKIIVDRTEDYLDEGMIHSNFDLFGALEIDSLDWLDIIFAIDHEFNIKIPLEEWTHQTSNGIVDSDYYFKMENFCDHIDRLVAENK